MQEEDKLKLPGGNTTRSTEEHYGIETNKWFSCCNRKTKPYRYSRACENKC